MQIKMGAETQLSLRMGVNHSKLFIKYFYNVVKLDPYQQKMNTDPQPWGKSFYTEI